jgi:uncharacterized protein (TIGR02594 family)
MDPAWLTIAYEELAAGVAETPGPRATPRIIEYFARTWQAGQHKDDGGKDNAWCAAFVTFCLEEAGVKTQKAVGARSYETFGEDTVPFRGAIAVLERAGQKHVAFIVGIDGDGWNMSYLGGNQANRVSVASFPHHRIVSIRKPRGFVVPAELCALPTIEAGEGDSTV